MIYRKTLWGGAALLGIAGAVWWWQGTRGSRLLPGALAERIPPETGQVILVLPDGMDGVPARVWLLARHRWGGGWRIEAGPMAANVGKNGTAWGRDGSGTGNPGRYPDKKEGDGRSPAGVFTVPAAFGTSPQPPLGTMLPWLECTATLRGVDDVKSKYYNQIVDEAVVTDKDWDSAEVMRQKDGLYEIGLVIGHNADAEPGAGSCIFLHIWRGPGQGTAGCTALARDDVKRMVEWLDPAFAPRLVLGVP